MWKEEKEAQLKVLAHLAASPPNGALSKADDGCQWDRQRDIMVWLCDGVSIWLCYLLVLNAGQITFRELTVRSV